MTTSNVFIINHTCDFEEQANAVRGLLMLSNDAVRRMGDCYTDAAAEAVCNINLALVDWIDHNLADELQRRSVSAKAKPALHIAAE